MELVKRIKQYISKHKLLTTGDKVIIGVSGGPDSVALIYILCELQHELGVTIEIAHFNHGLRKAAIKDQNFVENLAQKLHLKISCGSSHLSKSYSKGSLEEIARDARMNFFKRLVRRKKAQAICLAHTQNDLAETVLMRILRGTGLQGIRSILPVRKIQNIKFIRPLLGTKKQEIELFLKKRKLSFRIDPTNKQKKFYRNKIRLDLIPLLEKKYNKNVQEVLSHFSNNISVDYDFLEGQAKLLFNDIAKFAKDQRCVKFDLKEFNSKHLSMQRMMIRMAIEHLQGHTRKLSSIHLKEVEDLILNRPTESIVHLPRNVIVRKNRKFFSLNK